MTWAFDLLFGPLTTGGRAEDGGAFCAPTQRAEAECEMPSDLRNLIAMGFDEAAARTALERTGDNLAAAVELLVVLGTVD